MPRAFSAGGFSMAEEEKKVEKTVYFFAIITFYHFDPLAKYEHFNASRPIYTFVFSLVLVLSDSLVPVEDVVFFKKCHLS